MTPRNKLQTQVIILLAFILFWGMFSCDQSDPMQHTIINGVVTDFTDPYDLPAIELINYMPFNGEWNIYTCFIESDGAFHFKFELLYPQEIIIRFKRMINVYANPGDSIFVTIDAGILSDTLDRAENKYIRILSRDQRFQDEYQVFMQNFNDEFESSDDRQELKEAQKHMDHSDYARYIRDRTVKHQTFLDGFIKTNRPSRSFRVWADDWIYIQELEDLLRYEWIYPKINDLDRNAFLLPDAYYEFLKSSRHNNEKLFTSNIYRSFLNELYMHFYRKFWQSELGNKADSLYKAGQKTEAMRLELNYYMEHSDGFEQEYLTSRFFSGLILHKNLDIYDSLYEPSLIGRDDYIQILANEYAELRKHIDKPVFVKDLNFNYSGISKGNLIFQDLPEMFPDKVIYVDFWAPWCGPCMAEMPKSKELQAKLKEKNVVFVFIANRCSEESWKATITEKQLSGKHFLIADKEYALLADKFDIGGIPRYMVIDKNGKVVNDNAPQPSDKQTIELLQTLSEN